MEISSISPRAHRAPTVHRRPSQVHVDDVLLLNGQEARVREITVVPEPPLRPTRWVFDAVTGDAEIVATREPADLVEVAVGPQGVAA